MHKMEKDAKRWKLLVDRNVVKRSYIRDQTGLDASEITAFFEIADDMAKADGFDYDRIYKAMKRFFESELAVGNFHYIEAPVFSDIIGKLTEEFHLSNSELEKRIKKRINTNFSEQETEKNMEVMDGFLDYQIRKHGIENIMDMSELLEARRQKRKELRAEYERLEDLLTYGISFAVDIDPETGEYIEEEYTFSPEEIADIVKQRSELQTKIQQAESEIAQLMHQDKQDWEEYSALLCNQTASDDSAFSESRRMKKAESRTNRKGIAKEDYVYDAVQQKAILDIFFDLCTDQNGYVLPDHFGSGVNLAREIEEKITWQGNWKNFRGIQKVTYWANYDSSFEYGYHEPIERIEPSDPVYRLIAEHQNVFFHDPSREKIETFLKIFREVPQGVRKKLLRKLVDESTPIMSRTAKARAYCGILSEYYDILSLQIPVANYKFYSREEIYRIVYEIAAASNGSVTFSNELVQSVYLRIHFKAHHWQLQMYLSQYYYHHKEFDSLIEFIEKETEIPEI